MSVAKKLQLLRASQPAADLAQTSGRQHKRVRMSSTDAGRGAQGTGRRNKHAQIQPYRTPGCHVRYCLSRVPRALLLEQGAACATA